MGLLLLGAVYHTFR